MCIRDRDVPISTVFEAAKVFEHGGPFADLLTCAPSKVHKDTQMCIRDRFCPHPLMSIRVQIHSSTQFMDFSVKMTSKRPNAASHDVNLSLIHIYQHILSDKIQHYILVQQH